METLISAGFPSLLILIIGYFLKSHFDDIKSFQNETKLIRTQTQEKLDSIIQKIGTVNTEIAVIEANLKSHVEADESVQESMNNNINKIYNKLML